MKRLASLLLASALALTAAGCAGQNPAASTQSGPPEAVESGKSSVAYVEELRIGTTAAIDGANVMTGKRYLRQAQLQRGGHRCPL